MRQKLACLFGKPAPPVCSQPVEPEFCAECYVGLVVDPGLGRGNLHVYTQIFFYIVSITNFRTRREPFNLYCIFIPLFFVSLLLLMTGIRQTIPSASNFENNSTLQFSSSVHFHNVTPSQASRKLKQNFNLPENFFRTSDFISLGENHYPNAKSGSRVCRQLGLSRRIHSLSSPHTASFIGTHGRIHINDSW